MLMHLKLYLDSKYLAAVSFPEDISPTIPKINVSKSFFMEKLKLIYLRKNFVKKNNILFIYFLVF